MKTAIISFATASSAYGTDTGVDVTGTVACDGVSADMVVTFTHEVLDAVEIDVAEMVRMVTSDRPVQFEWDGAFGPEAQAGTDGTLMVPTITAATIIDFNPIGAALTEADAPRIAAIIAADIGRRFGHTVQAKPVRMLKGTGYSIGFRMAIERNFGIMDMLPIDAHLIVGASTSNGNRTDVSVSMRITSSHRGAATMWIGRWWLRRDRILGFEPALPMSNRRKKKAA